MKILQILPAMDTGHVARSAMDMAKALVVAGHASIVVSNGGPLTTRLEREGSTHISLPVHQKNLTSLWQVKPLRQVIEKHKPDIIHLRTRMCAWITRLALKGIPENQRPKTVSTIHHMYPVSIYGKVITESDCVICVSDYVADHVKTHFPNCPPENIRRIYRGVDEKFFPYRYQPSVHWWNGVLAEFPHLDKKIWLTLPGTISQSRGHEWIIDILGGLKSDYPDIHAVIIGDPKSPKSTYYEELQQRISSLDLEDYVTFTGWRDDIRDWLAASNLVFSLVNKPLAYSQTVMESLALGTPVIAWNQGGVAETLNRLFPQGLIETHDGLALCEKVRELLDSSELPKKPEEFILRKMTKEALDIYKSLLPDCHKSKPKKQTKTQPSQSTESPQDLPSTEKPQTN